jgi:hypothetical protein
MQILGEGGKRSHRIQVAIGGHSDENLCGSDINTGSIGSHFGQTPIQLPMFSFLRRLCHGIVSVR